MRYVDVNRPDGQGERMKKLAVCLVALLLVGCEPSQEVKEKAVSDAVHDFLQATHFAPVRAPDWEKLKADLDLVKKYYPADNEARTSLTLVLGIMQAQENAHGRNWDPEYAMPTDIGHILVSLSQQYSGPSHPR